MIAFLLSGLFFFQAEDGIRDLVRSRGLGDVYKRQVRAKCDAAGKRFEYAFLLDALMDEQSQGITIDTAVSYTHLTLPTSDLV